MRLLVLAILLGACAPLPEAPGELDELAVYFYENHPDEDLRVMAVGADNLVDWLSEQEALEDNYAIGILDEGTVDSLDDTDRSTDGLLGLAVITSSEHPLDDAAFGNTAAPLEEVYGDTYSEVEKDITGDVDCFVDRDCERLEVTERYLATFAFDTQSRSHLHNQYVWAEGENGWAYVQRQWTVEPPVTNSAILEVVQHHYLNVFVTNPEGGHWRLQATWMIPADNGIDHNLALNTVGNSMRGSSEDLDAWIDANR